MMMKTASTLVWAQCLWLSVCTTAFQIPSSASSLAHTLHTSGKRTNRNAPLYLSSLETVIEFNRDFRNGLLDVYAQHAQAKTTDVPFFADSSTRSVPSSLLADASLDEATQSLMGDIMESTSSVPPETIVDNSVLQEASRNANEVLKAAKSLSASNQLERSQNIIQDALYRLTHTPPPTLQLPDPGEGGLSKPIVEFVKRSLYDLRDRQMDFVQHNFPNQPPKDYQTIYGLQVKDSVFETLDNIQKGTIQGMIRLKNGYSYVYQQTEVSFANSAPMRAQFMKSYTPLATNVRSALYQNYDSYIVHYPERRQMFEDTMAPFNDNVQSTLYQNYDSFVVQYPETKQRFLDNAARSNDNVRETLMNNMNQLREKLQTSTGSMDFQAPFNDNVRETLRNNLNQLQEKLQTSTGSMDFQAPFNDNVRETLRNNMNQLQEKLQASTTGASRSVDFRPPSLNLEEFSAVKDNLNRLLRTSSWSSRELMEVLNVKELGGYYAGAVLGILLLSSYLQRSQQATVATSPSTVTPKQKKVVPKPARKPSPTQAQKQAKQAEKERLEGTVLELTEAVAILTNELRELKAKKSQTDYDMATMKSDVRTVKNEVDKTSSSEVELMTKMQELATQNAKLQNQLEAVKLEAETQDALKEAMRSLKAVDERQSPHPPETPPPTKTVMSMEALENTFFATPAERPPKKETVADPKPLNDGDDWSDLPLSALKRKPLTEIISYLQQKGAAYTDAQGKILNKNELLKTVVNLA